MCKKVYVRNLFITACLMVLIISLFMLNADLAMAAAQPGQSFGTWILDQAFWVALAVVAVVAIPLILKKSWVPLGIFLLVAAIVLVVISNPSRLTGLGNIIWEAFGL